MADASSYTSFLGTGWSFPPAFVRATGQVQMVSDEDDIDQSLRVLFGTTIGERLFDPAYGLDMHEVLFEPASTTLRAFVTDRVKVAVLFYEPRIDVLALTIDSPDPNGGVLRISLDYEVRATNSRYNLVYPFYLSDGNEAVMAFIPTP